MNNGMLTGFNGIVLIETLWNVKTLGTLTVNSVAGVLIETLWNVKKVNSIYYFEPGGRINRNIVECKAKNLALHWLVSPRINRNIVECKGRKQKEKSRMKIVLIETLWNVKRK